MATIVLTGAAGRIGSSLRSRLTGHELRLTDIRPLPTPPAAHESFVQCPLASEQELEGLMVGADLVFHLGGAISDVPYQEIMHANVDGTHSVLEAARKAGVRRLLYASSNHAVGYTPIADLRTTTSTAELTLRPDSFYGMTKVAAEALCSLYADTYDLTVISVRILTFKERPMALRELSTWLSPDDMARLVEAILTVDAPGHHYCWGVSNNTRRWASRHEGEALGFFPQDDAEIYAEEILAASKPEDAERLITIGGRIPPQLRSTDTRG